MTVTLCQGDNLGNRLHIGEIRDAEPMIHVLIGTTIGVRLVRSIKELSVYGRELAPSVVQFKSTDFSVNRVQLNSA